ncbi:MAG TPA: CBS domain-containing protein [Sedimentisphaerales bacterium]|nr:CBS domain-containing protein [Sedimentisphaerales bacterium]
MQTERFRLVDIIDDIFAGKDVFFRSVRLAEDVMTTEVKTLSLDDTVETCFKFLKVNKVRHVPLMDPSSGEEGRPYFVGIVSQRDLFRQVSLYAGKVGERDSDQKALQQPLSRIVTRKPKTVSPKTPIWDAIAVMVSNRFDMIPVLSDSQLTGIITNTDILKLFVRVGMVRRLCAAKKKAARIVDLASGGPDGAAALLSSVVQAVRDIMTEQVVCLKEQDTMAEAIETMQRGIFRHVPVVDQHRRMAGVVSDRDVLRHLSFVNKPLSSRAKGFRDQLFATEANDPALRLPLSRIMTSKVVYVSPDCDVYDAAKMLHELTISCLPVLDGEKQILGIVTVTDVMRALLAAYNLNDHSKDDTEAASMEAQGGQR